MKSIHPWWFRSSHLFLLFTRRRLNFILGLCLVFRHCLCGGGGGGWLLFILVRLGWWDHWGGCDPYGHLLAGMDRHDVRSNHVGAAEYLLAVRAGGGTAPSRDTLALPVWIGLESVLIARTLFKCRLGGGGVGQVSYILASDNFQRTLLKERGEKIDNFNWDNFLLLFLNIN
jgi:hypothetical protein